MRHIEVINLHAWAMRFMKKQGADFRLADDRTINDCLDEAIQAIGGGFQAGFYKEELDQIIRMSDIITMEEYLKCPRIGRRVRLTRPNGNRYG